MVRLAIGPHTLIGLAPRWTAIAAVLVTACASPGDPGRGAGGATSTSSGATSAPVGQGGGATGSGGRGPTTTTAAGGAGGATTTTTTTAPADGGGGSVSRPCEEPPGAVRCDGACVDLSSDEQNCGACGAACAPDVCCYAGHCMVGVCGDCSPCAEGLACCPVFGSGDPGYCADVKTDPMNCGACGLSCGFPSACVDGECIQGCKLGPPCGEGLVCCPLGMGCTDVSKSQTDCGGCGNFCFEGPCVDGVCTKAQ